MYKRGCHDMHVEVPGQAGCPFSSSIMWYLGLTPSRQAGQQDPLSHSRPPAPQLLVLPQGGLSSSRCQLFIKLYWSMAHLPGIR